MYTLPTTMSLEVYRKIYRALREEAVKFFHISKDTFDYRVRQQMPLKYSWKESEGEWIIHVTNFSKAEPYEWVDAAIAVMHDAESAEFDRINR